MKLTELTGHQLREKLLAGEITSEELAAEVFERIEEKEREVNAYILLFQEDVLSQARGIDRKIGAGEEVGVLAGTPVAVKDNICVRGAPASCGSKILSNFTPPYDATVVQRLRDADALIVGKANMDEFAMGSSSETSCFGPVKNPYDSARIPGGSSGGSAAAVASGETILALGSDTGGSVRQPAGFCGVVGLKPTYGRVSRYGLVAYASSLDQIGPLTKDVADCALLLGVIAGHDPRDSTSAGVEVPDYLAALNEGVDGVRIGLPKEYFSEGLDQEVEKAIKGSVAQLEGLGAKVDEVSLPHTDYAIATYYIIATAEASSNLARYDGARYGFRSGNPEDLFDMYAKSRSEGFGEEVKRRIMLGTYVLSAGYYEAYYRKAQKVRTLIKGDFDKAFEEFNVLITPTSPTPAFKLGEKLDDPLTMYLSDIYTISVNLAGIPAISVPCGYSSTGLPIGLQILGKPFDEEMVLRVAYAVERMRSGGKNGK